MEYCLSDGDGSKRVVRRSLAEGLGLGDGAPDERWIVFRVLRASLVYLTGLMGLLIIDGVIPRF